MNIAFITPTLEQGGYEKVIVNYSNALTKMGHDVTILCGFKKGAYVEQINSKVQIIEFKARYRDFFLPLFSYLKNNKIDLLYSGFRSYNLMAIIAKKISKSGAKIYASQHGHEKSRMFLRNILGICAKRADYLVAVSEGVAINESNFLNISEREYYILNNPIIDSGQSIIKEKHPWFNKNDEYKIIGVSGRLATVKNIRLAVDILYELIKYRKLNVKLLILGDGPEKEKLQRYVNEQELNNHVDFMGYVKNPMGYISQCDIYLHTAIQEGLGNTIVEALFAEVPVVSTTTSGSKQILGNNEYGLLIGDALSQNVIKTGANEIMKIFNNEIHFTSLRERALEYDIKNAANQFLNLYLDKES